MKFTINIEKKYFWILAALVVIVGGILVFAVVPNPGHGVDQIDWTQTVNLIKANSILVGSGNVGIGTNNPAQKLDVSGSIQATGDVKGNRLCIGTDCKNSWSLDSQWTASGNNIYYTSGNVGIGTNNPTEKLDVAGNIKGTRFIGDGSGLTNIPSSAIQGTLSQWTNVSGGISYGEGNVGIGTTTPSAKLEVNGSIKASGTICDGNGCIKSSLPPLKIEVYNSDTTTYACVHNVDLEEYCGDADGCRIRLLMQHETSGNDEVRNLEEIIYMEQPDLSSNNGVGIYGHTWQGNGEYFWITGMSNRYTIFSPWSWVWMLNYKHGNCPGQSGNSVPYTDQYTFTFMSLPVVRANFIVYDEP